MQLLLDQSSRSHNGVWWGRALVGFIGTQQGCVHGLHAGGAGERAHQPGVDAVQVVDVKARQEPDWIAIFKIHHADHTLFYFLLRGIRARVKDTFGKMVDESDTLSDADLLLLGQLGGQTTLTWCGMEDWHRWGVLIGGRGLSGKTPHLRFVQQREVIPTLRKQAIPH